MSAEAASEPNRPNDGGESVAANLERLEGAVKRLSWLATIKVAPGVAADEALMAVTADRDRLAGLLAALQADHDRLKADYTELEQQRLDLGQRLDGAIERLRGLVPGGL